MLRCGFSEPVIRDLVKNALGGQGPLCGHSGPMLLQRHAPWLLDQIAGWLAAVQSRFSEAIIQYCEIGGNPNRPFAA